MNDTYTCDCGKVFSGRGARQRWTAHQREEHGIDFSSTDDDPDYIY